MNHQQFGQSYIDDDELEVIDENPNTNINFDYSLNHDGGFNQFTNGMGMNMPPNAQMYSNTPDNQPIASPFMNNNFNYAQYGNMMNGFAGRKMPGQDGQRGGPITPNTPGFGGLHMGNTPDSLGQAAMLNHQLNQHAKMTADQWSATPGSGSWSPLASPTHHLGHPTIPEVMAGKGIKLEGAQSASLPPSLQTQEAKKKRRRESHNLVERRRRDNINERIQDLARLVPGHRLQDEALKKHIQANGAIAGASGVSPPSGLLSTSGPGGRRNTPGTITQGLPHEEKEKGPNKGDILNGSVAWMRDLMWMLYKKEKQLQQVRGYFENSGTEWPITTPEEEQRMMNELMNVVDKVGPNAFSYSRGPGSGLFVPGFTDIEGKSIAGDDGQKGAASRRMRVGGSADLEGTPEFKNDPGSVGSTGYDDIYAGMIKEEDDGMYAALTVSTSVSQLVEPITAPAKATFAANNTNSKEYNPTTTLDEKENILLPIYLPSNISNTRNPFRQNQDRVEAQKLGLSMPSNPAGILTASQSQGMGGHVAQVGTNHPFDLRFASNQALSVQSRHHHLYGVTNMINPQYHPAFHPAMSSSPVKPLALSEALTFGGQMGAFSYALSQAPTHATSTASDLDSRLMINDDEPALGNQSCLAPGNSGVGGDTI